ncbi:MAG TPA: DUF6458 family protein [Micromonosporaceae bacterium]|nr:DUF6458 family protein [Micromonosporaceae bacterium]
MGIGGSIFLIALGAIIAFGVRDQTVGPFDLNVIGWVLMLAGLVGLALTTWFWQSRRTRTVAGPPSYDPPAPPPPGDHVVEERYTERRY